MGRVLARTVGVLEPFQTAKTVDGQVEELSKQIDSWAVAPVTLIGHSWGAWLALLLAGKHPEQVRRLVLIGCGPLTNVHATEVGRRRRQRLSADQQKEYDECEHQLSGISPRPALAVLRRLGQLAAVADSYDLLPSSSAGVRFDVKTFQSVWPEADAKRRSGGLARALRRVRAPILVLHGEADPHPSEGVIGPLRKAGATVRAVVFPRCGHEPWRERYARDRFFNELRAEVIRA